MKFELPERWSIDESQPGYWVIEAESPAGYITIETNRREFYLGMGRGRKVSTNSYTGRGWQDRIKADAVAYLQKILAPTITIGQAAHDAGAKAGCWSRTWGCMSRRQQGEWEEIGEAAAKHEREHFRQALTVASLHLQGKPLPADADLRALLDEALKRLGDV